MKHITYTLLLVAAMLCNTAAAQSQDAGRHQRHNRENAGQQMGPRFSPEEFNQLMENYIRQHTNLTDDEAKAVFPLLREMQEQQRKLNTASRKAAHEIKSDATEDEAKKTLAQMLSLREREAAVQTEYINKIAAKTSALKTIAILNAQEQFHRQMFRPNGGNKGNRGQGQNGKWKGKK